MKLKICCALLLAWAQVYAEDGPQTVVVNGQTDVEASRDFVAGKLIISRKTLEDSGQQNVGDALKREPAVTIGKDGRLGLLGLPGYTQLLVDGKESSFDPYAMDLAQVERIEIIKSATAATGPFGIAGTINIIRRKIARQTMTQLKAGATTASGYGGANATLVSSQLPSSLPLSYNVVLMASSRTTPSATQYQQTQSLNGAAPAPQLQGDTTSASRFDMLMASSEIAWTVDPRHKLSFNPEASYFGTRAHGDEQRRWVDDSSLSVARRQRQDSALIGLPFVWEWKISDDSRLSLKPRFNRMHIDDTTHRREDWSAEGDHLREQGRDRDMINRFLDLTFNTSVAGGHDVSTGLKLVKNDASNDYTDLIDGRPDLSQAVLGTSAHARVERYQVFAQDEWRVNKNLSLNLGLSGEQRQHALDEGDVHHQPRFRVWSPTAHVAYKIDGNSKRQLRASVARAFQAPESDQLLLHPSINPLAPCYDRALCGANTLDTADSAGNPDLSPERSLGVNLSYAHGLGASSEAKIEIYTRDIRHKIGTELALQNVAWASVPRYVVRPANLGDATLRGINLDGRLALRDVWKTAPNLDLQGSVGYAHSALRDLPGPDNRLDGQLPWRAKLSAGYAPAEAPVKLNLDANWLPGDWFRNNLTQRTYQSYRYTLNASANWKVNATQRVIVSADNLLAKDNRSISEYYGLNQTLRRYTNSDAYTRFSVRLETSL
ncbi:outer membrane receptor for ferrienterochelin and colicin [Duganella sp. 1224]|uniref:TonB-dependent receptor n=1 Tax=Duganella sp. 1224 TaxID=2587052 RepID=UPI0015C70A09|nr:TonB-dependent receptor [Duganella sp. 1224]NYE63003.1 outer membrane receptor for ferrienterochelin and colicin [Duganella sp. 1224]